MVSSASLVVARVALGMALAVEALRFIGLGWIDAHLVGPSFHFAYPGLGWARPMSLGWMTAFFWGLVLMGVVFAAGARTRALAMLNLLGWGYVVAIDRALYLNHHYLVLNLLLVWCLMPSVRLRGMISRFWLRLFRWLLVVIYVWAGVSKLDPDWFAGIPVAMGTGGLAVLPGVGGLLTHPVFVRGISWALIGVELGAPLWLGWRRTRPLAVTAFAAFHVSTAFFYDIGIFPWLSLSLLLLWCAPEWPLRVLRRQSPDAASLDVLEPSGPPRWRQRLAVAFLVAHMVLPARSLASPGRHAWTGAGIFASWRLLTAQKTGWVRFEIVELETGARVEVSPLRELTVWQAGKLGRNADMIVTYARHLARGHMQATGGGPVAVYARSGVSLNGRQPQPLFDPGLNLTPEFAQPGAAPIIAQSRVRPLETPPPEEPSRMPSGWWEANMWGATAILSQVQLAVRAQDEPTARAMTALLPRIEDMSLLDATGAALALLRIGLRDEATKMLDRPAREGESVCGVMLRLDDALKTLGERRLGQRALERCVAQRRDMVALGRLADRAIAAGAAVDAERWLALMVIEDPAALEPSLKLAELYAKYLDRPDEARRLLDTVALRYPGHARVATVRRVLDERAKTP